MKSGKSPEIRGKQSVFISSKSVSIYKLNCYINKGVSIPRVSIPPVLGNQKTQAEASAGSGTKIEEFSLIWGLEMTSKSFWKQFS